MTASNHPIAVFISHAHADLLFARRLARTLQSHGIRVWLAEDKVQVGDSLVETIDRGLSEASAVIVVVSRNSTKSKWSQYEWQAVVASEPTGERPKLIIPVLLDDSFVPMPLADLKYADFSRDFDHPMAELVDSLQRRFPNATRYVPQRRPLPVMPSLFIGRNNELHEIAKAFNDHVAVLIVGLGGIGKTSLALQWAKWTRETEFASDFVWISCQSQTPTAFVTDLEQQLGLSSTPDSTKSRIRTIAEYLRTAHIALILDDVADEFSPLLGALLAGLSQSQPTSRILMTSRTAPQKLDLLDVAVLQLSSFAIDESMTFLQNALARSSKSLATEDLRRIASWSQGVPLALQLVSALLLQDRSVDEILSVPAGQFDEIDLGASLSRSFAFAYERLTDDEQEALRAIALFADSPISLRTLGTILGLTDSLKVDSFLQTLSSFGLVHVENQRISVHSLLRALVLERVPTESPSTSGTLYITLDPSLMGKEDFVELLDALNAIYAHLSGDELLIREDESGRFAKAGVLV